MYKGLSTDQAPPISVPFRFFITAPFFAILIGLIFINYPLDSIFNRYSNIAIAVTHIFTLGVLSMLIIGAMLQMLPVLAGVVIKNSIIFANVVHISLTIGTLGLSGGFLFESNLALSIGGLFLVIAFFTFFFTIIKSLFKVTYITSTVNGMKFFSIGGLITILLGIFLIYSHIVGEILSVGKELDEKNKNFLAESLYKYFTEDNVMHKMAEVLGDYYSISHILQQAKLRLKKINQRIYGKFKKIG